MDNAPSHDERFVRLETKIAYQEKLIAELNDVVSGHEKTLDRLEFQLKQLQHFARDQGGEPMGHERPPHY